MARLQRRDVRLSSRELDWGPLHLERRESDPGSIEFAAGATEHLVFVSLAHARIRCERGATGRRARRRTRLCRRAAEPHAGALVLAHTPVLRPARAGPGIPAHRRGAGTGHGRRSGGAGARRARVRPRDLQHRRRAVPRADGAPARRPRLRRVARADSGGAPAAQLRQGPAPAGGAGDAAFPPGRARHAVHPGELRPGHRARGHRERRHASARITSRGCSSR